MKKMAILREDEVEASATYPVPVSVTGLAWSKLLSPPDYVGVRWFADAGCETCRLNLFEVTRNHKRAGRPHSHSADEIIFLVDGTIELGAYHLQPGTALCIPGGVRYAEGSGPDGAVFINYRRETSDRTHFFKDKPPSTAWEAPATPTAEIGRASCRERG